MSASEISACDDRLPALVDAAEGALEPAARADLDAHLAACAGCRTELADLRATTTLLAATRFEPDPLQAAGFAARTADAAERFRDRSFRGFWWALPRPQRLATVFSATALAASVLVLAVARQPVEPVADDAAPLAARVDPAPALPADDELFEFLDPDAPVAAGSEQLAATELDGSLEAFADLDDEDLDALMDMLETT